MEETTELDLRELFYVIRKHMKGILAGLAVGLICAVLISMFVLPKKYTSSVSLYVNNGQPILNNALNVNDINASQKLVGTYIVILQDEHVIEQVAEQLSRPVSAAKLAGMISMGAVNDTEVLSISANTEDPQLSAEICNVFADIAPEVLQRVVKAGSVEVLGEAKAATAPSSPSVVKNALIGALIGLVLMIGWTFYREMADNTVKSEDDLRKHVDVPVLGEIPKIRVEKERR
ncbi:YveK family protein [Anaeromassilibacillus senegalensis]|uniref:YveK family protein n=1 Tax=Anaeromassilibacillus senegalensis TaxID=1673717 RepID=UPI00068059CF|nr:Wzz/FepE/Etk N-terminal domain-containing protein [Anaeromassilibacillus senegalensis]